jgi:hypothetical protein
MPDNQNHSAGSGRHSQRSGARIVSGSRGSGSDVDPNQAYLEEMRERSVPAVLQFEFIRDLEAREMDDN